MNIGDKVRLIHCPDNLRGGRYRIAHVDASWVLIETLYGPRRELISNCITERRGPKNLKAKQGFKYV